MVPSKYFRVSYYSSWILETACAITNDDSFNLCPKMVCPAEEVVLGYPQAKVPDATDMIKTYGGFKPRKVVQSPPAGSLINISAKVVVTAVDQSDRAASCEWWLTIPMIEGIGEAYLEVQVGTNHREINLWNDDFGFSLGPGLVLMFTARLEHRLDGNSTVAVSTAFHESLTLSSVVNEGTLWLEKPFPNGMSNITLQEHNVVTENNMIISVYGQLK